MPAPSQEALKQTPVPLPPELDGTLHDPFDVRGEYAWSYDTPSLPTLPLDLRDKIDPLIARDVADFQATTPDADIYHLQAERDASMLRHCFDRIHRLPPEEQVVTIGLLTQYARQFELDSRNVYNQAENRYTHPEVISDIPDRTMAAMNPLQLNTVLFSQRLATHLGWYRTVAVDTELQAYAKDMEAANRRTATLATDILLCFVPDDIRFITQDQTSEDVPLPIVLEEDLKSANPFGFGDGASEGLEMMFKIGNINFVTRLLINLYGYRKLSAGDMQTLHEAAITDRLSGVDSTGPFKSIYDLSEDSLSTLAQLTGFDIEVPGYSSDKLLEYLAKDPKHNFARLQKSFEYIGAGGVAELTWLMENPHIESTVADMLFELLEDGAVQADLAMRLMNEIGNARLAAEEYGMALSDASIDTDSSENRQRAEALEDGIVDSIGYRMAELISAAHALSRDGSASGVLAVDMRPSGRVNGRGQEVWEPITREAQITNAEQIVASSKLIVEALHRGFIIAAHPERVTLGNENPHIRATFTNSQDATKYFGKDLERDTDARIIIRASEDDVGQARIGLNYRISKDAAEQLVPLLSELMGEEFDAQKFLGDTQKSRDMRTLNLRLDLENLDGFGLSLDIGGSSRPSRSPLDYLIACAVSAGAAEFAKLEPEYSNGHIPNNHVRDYFDLQLESPDSFNKLLRSIISGLDTGTNSQAA
jgi:hypothetical protein